MNLHDARCGDVAVGVGHDEVQPHVSHRRVAAAILHRQRSANSLTGHRHRLVDFEAHLRAHIATVRHEQFEHFLALLLQHRLRRFVSHTLRLHLGCTYSLFALVQEVEVEGIVGQTRHQRLKLSVGQPFRFQACPILIVHEVFSVHSCSVDQRQQFRVVVHIDEHVAQHSIAVQHVVVSPISGQHLLLHVGFPPRRRSLPSALVSDVISKGRRDVVAWQRQHRKVGKVAHLSHFLSVELLHARHPAEPRRAELFFRHVFVPLYTAAHFALLCAAAFISRYFARMLARDANAWYAGLILRRIGSSRRAAFHYAAAHASKFLQVIHHVLTVFRQPRVAACRQNARTGERGIGEVGEMVTNPLHPTRHTDASVTVATATADSSGSSGTGFSHLHLVHHIVFDIERAGIHCLADIKPACNHLLSALFRTQRGLVPSLHVSAGGTACHLHRNCDGLLRQDVPWTADKRRKVVAVVLFRHTERSARRLHQSDVGQIDIEGVGHLLLRHDNLFRSVDLHHRFGHMGLVSHRRDDVVLVLHLRFFVRHRHADGVVFDEDTLGLRHARTHDDALRRARVFRMGHCEQIGSFGQVFERGQTVAARDTLVHQLHRDGVLKRHRRSFHVGSLFGVIGKFVPHVNHKSTAFVRHRLQTVTDVQAAAVLTTYVDVARHHRHQFHVGCRRQLQHNRCLFALLERSHAGGSGKG